MRTPTNPTAISFQKQLLDLGLSGPVVEFEETTRTAVDAANAIGCTLPQIVKSLIFKTKHSGQPVLVLTSGPNRVSETLVEELAGEPLGKADADFVRQATGYAIGGVPPFVTPPIVHTFIDETFMQFDEIWAAAGTPNAVFPLSPQELVDHSQGQVAKVAA